MNEFPAYSPYSKINTLNDLINLCVTNHKFDTARSKKYFSDLDCYYGENEGTIKDKFTHSDVENESSNGKDNCDDFGSINNSIKSESSTAASIQNDESNSTFDGFYNKKNINKNISGEEYAIWRGKERREVGRRNSSENKRIHKEKQSGKGFEQSIRRSNSGTLTKAAKRKCKKQFKRGFNPQSPVSYSCLSSNFVSAHKSDQPVFLNTPSREDIDMESQKAFDEYTCSENKLSRNLQFLICRSVLSSFDILGIPRETQEKGDIKPVSIRKSVRELSKSTNSGFPSFRKKNLKTVVSDTIFWLEDYLKRPTFYRLSKRFAKESVLCSSSDSSFSDISTLPTSIFHRLQISPVKQFSNIFKTKIRPVWCVPYSVVSLEHMFFKPMIDACRQNTELTENPVYPTGCTNKQLSEKVAIPMHRRMRRRTDKYIRSFDFSKFDRNIRTEYTSFIFTIWGTNLKMSKNYWKAYTALRYYSCYTPFVYKDEIMVTRRGVCSGSYTTNIRDTIVNLSLVISALTIKYGCPDLARSIVRGELLELDHTRENFINSVNQESFNFNTLPFSVFGDDGIMFEDEEFFLIHKFICGAFSLTVNYEDPVRQGESFFFLGRFWDKNGIPWQTEAYMIAHIKFRSKWFDKKALKFNISEHLDLYRVLSICCPLRDGRDFMFKFLSEWQPFKTFVSGTKGYYLLKEWPHNEYTLINRVDAFEVMRY